MKLTPKLKSWVFKNTDLEESASDEDIKQAVGVALASDELSVEKYKELSTTEEDVQANGLKSLLGEFTSALKDMKEAMTSSKSSDNDEDDEEVETKAVKAKKSKKPKAAVEDEEDEDEEDEEEEKKSSKARSKKSGPSDLEKAVLRMSTPMLADDDDGEEKSFEIRVKEAAEQYSDTKSALVYPSTDGRGVPHYKAGQPVTDWNDRQIDTPSDRAKAVSGAWGKFLAAQAVYRSKQTAFMRLPQHDRELILYAAEKMLWGGTTDNRSDDGGDEDIKGRRLTPSEQKALFDDAVSGGLEAAPIVFDDQYIVAPLLNGELYPGVKVVPIDRGRRIEGVRLGNVTGSWGGVDDTAISLFNTASYVSAFDTTIFRWEGAIRIGLDFLSDTPLEFNSILTEQYGERMLEDLDDVIATGNGTNQPEGITVKSGTSSVNFGSAAATLGGYESLRFGVSKAEHKGGVGQTAVFIGSETSYQRAKAIPVGASDVRRLSQTVTMPNYNDYMWMDRPYKINESLGNTKICYALLGRYRMYRRRGLSMRTSTEGDTLIRANEMLIVAMARYGGQLERGACAAVTTTAQA